MTDAPLTLAFDTSAAHCAAALLRGTDTAAIRAEAMTRGQAERLMPLLEELLLEAGAGWGDLGRIGVGIGPGNFTGIRIAVSAARGLALALDIPAIGVSTFDAIDLDAGTDHVAVVPAPRDQVYARVPGHAPLQMSGAGLTDFRKTAIMAPAPEPLALRIARFAAAADPADHAAPAPLYIRAADAAPPRDAPPVIVP